MYSIFKLGSTTKLHVNYESWIHDIIKTQKGGVAFYCETFRNTSIIHVTFCISVMPPGIGGWVGWRNYTTDMYRIMKSN